MSVPTVARKDFEDAVRSQMLWSMTGLLVGLIVLIYGAVRYFEGSAPADELAAILALPMQVIVPLAALIVGYMAIVGERRSGSIKILLSLPPTREDVVAGKLLGRAGVVATAVLAAFAVALVLGLVLFGEVAVGELFGLAVATLLLGFAFVGIAVGFSAAVASRGRAMAGVVGTYLVFLGFWDVLVGGIYRLATGAFPPGIIPMDGRIEPWALALQRLNPMEAYGVVASGLMDQQVFPLTLQFPIGVNVVGNEPLEDVVIGEVPFYLSEWFSAVVLLAWFVVPVALGYLRFRNADLG
ncbi:ABC transporter permease subunit [Natranaeroarchaeum aerophilus]|uniref:ABC transporter permease n=1 Tax=Natranaeroarchaeum aerophilus TaxID=2917711 RepID=A0AAE3FTU6_9EURY|nr:ABC transporter permease subunit [Natranaeroarchaeum aerophilus]MCL9815244.1 ABC transporter permease [Natranaeroarchaeum aerophilus]